MYYQKAAHWKEINQRVLNGSAINQCADRDNQTTRRQGNSRSRNWNNTSLARTWLMREGSRLRSGSHEAPPISSPALESPCASCAGFDQNPASKGAVEMPSAAVSLRGQRRPENVTIEEGKQLKGMSQALLTSHSAPSCLSCLLHSPSLFSTQQSMSFHNINQIILCDGRVHLQ